MLRKWDRNQQTSERSQVYIRQFPPFCAKTCCRRQSTALSWILTDLWHTHNKLFKCTFLKSSKQDWPRTSKGLLQCIMDGLKIGKALFFISEPVTKFSLPLPNISQSTKPRSSQSCLSLIFCVLRIRCQQNVSLHCDEETRGVLCARIEAGTQIECWPNGRSSIRR